MSAKTEAMSDARDRGKRLELADDWIPAGRMSLQTDLTAKSRVEQTGIWRADFGWVVSGFPGGL